MKYEDSKFEYFDNVYVISKYIFVLIANNFGFGEYTNSLKVFCNLANMTDSDRDKFKVIAKTYNLDVCNAPYIIFDEYKRWLFEEYKRMTTFIVYANSIYPYNSYELNRKKEYIENSINSCSLMIQILQIAESLFKVDHNAMIQIGDLLLREITQLKNWKMSAQKYFDKIRKKEILEKFSLEKSFINGEPIERPLCPCPVEFLDVTENEKPIKKELDIRVRKSNKNE